jgi:hypothetical protein
MEQPSMNDILSGKDPVKSEPAAVQVETSEPAVQADTAPPVERPVSRKVAHRDKEQLAQGRVRDPQTGQYAPKAEPEPEKTEPVKAEPVKAEPAKPAPVQEFTDKEKAFLKGMQEERTKRQALETRLAAMEADKAKAPAEPAKTFWDAPEEALTKQQANFARQFAEVRREIATGRLNTAEMIARKNHPDFDEKVAVFGELLKTTPGLYQKWMAEVDPAEFAYATAKSHSELKEAGDVPALRAKIEKETRIKIEGELKAKAEALEKERAALPPSLSDARSVAPNKRTWGGPPSMQDILSGKA